jgi:hypothetical protein
VDNFPPNPEFDQSQERGRRGVQTGPTETEPHHTARGYVDNRAKPERCASPVFPRKTGKCSLCPHTHRHPHPARDLISILEDKGRPASTPRLAGEHAARPRPGSKGGSGFFRQERKNFRSRRKPPLLTGPVPRREIYPQGRDEERAFLAEQGTGFNADSVAERQRFP